MSGDKYSKYPYSIKQGVPIYQPTQPTSNQIRNEAAKLLPRHPHISGP